jgi:hypothetical protein
MPDPIVTDIPPFNQYTAMALQTAFNFSFLAFAQTDVVVYQTPAGTVANDANNILTYNVQYTVALNPLPALGGIVTLITGANAGDIITIVRAMPDNRLNNYIAGGLFQATDVNTDFDRTVLMAQQNKFYDQNIGVHYNISSTPVVSTDTVLPILPANCIWMKSADNTEIQAVLTTGSVSPFAVQLPTTDNAIARYDGVAGGLQNSGVLISDANAITGAASLVSGNISIGLIGANTISTTNANGNILLTPNGTGITQITTGKALRFYEPTNTNYTALEAGPNVASVTFKLPIADGTADQLLKTDAAGQLAFTSNPFVQMVKASSVTPANTNAIIPADNTIPQIGEGTELITLAITPKNAANTLIVEFYCPIVGNTTNNISTFALFRDAGADALTAATTFVPGVGNPVAIQLKYYVIAGSTAATTFRIRYGTNANSVFVLTSANGVVTFGGVPQLNLTITEVT